MLYDQEYILKEQLEHGFYYKGRCRNAEIARWNEDEQRFYHWRTKFGATFIETILHPEDDDVFDVFYPHEWIDTPKQEIPFEER